MTTDFIKEYLVHSYLYYVLAEPIISDFTFDYLCLVLSETWDDLNSPYKDQVRGGGRGMRGQDGLAEHFSEEIKQEAHGRLVPYSEDRTLVVPPR